MRIRPATFADIPAIIACAQASYAQYVQAIGRPPAPMIADYAAPVADGHVHVAQGTVLTGFCICVPRVDSMLLENVAVLPAQTGKGIGKALIAHCEKLAKAQGLPRVVLYTNAKMTANLGLYPHLGYIETGRRVEDGFARVYFEKSLT